MAAKKKKRPLSKKAPKTKVLSPQKEKGDPILWRLVDKLNVQRDASGKWTARHAALGTLVVLGDSEKEARKNGETVLLAFVEGQDIPPRGFVVAQYELVKNESLPQVDRTAAALILDTLILNHGDKLPCPHGVTREAFLATVVEHLPDMDAP